MAGRQPPVGPGLDAAVGPDQVRPPLTRPPGRGAWKRRCGLLSPKRLANAEVVDPAKRAKTGQVFFGATVTTANARDEERTLKIVGVDEVDLAKGHVSWISPIAKALMRAEEGDVVKLRTPTGVEELEIVKVEYL